MYSKIIAMPREKSNLTIEREYIEPFFMFFKYTAVVINACDV